MDSMSANTILITTTKTIINMLWGEVKDSEWVAAVEQMENAMNATHAVIQHANIIPSIVIAIQQLLHPCDAPWPNWMAMIEWSPESVGFHSWSQIGTIAKMSYEVGHTVDTLNENVERQEELSMMQEEQWGTQILAVKMEVDLEDEMYWLHIREQVKGKRKAKRMDEDEIVEMSSADKRKADDEIEEECEHGQLWT